jgi:hypothetical protein
MKAPNDRFMDVYYESRTFRSLLKAASESLSICTKNNVKVNTIKVKQTHSETNIGIET